MSSLMLAANDLRMKSGQLFAESAEVYETAENLRRDIITQSPWAQPITARKGKINRAALQVPEASYVFYRDASKLDFHLNFAWEGLVTSEEFLTALSPETRSSFSIGKLLFFEDRKAENEPVFECFFLKPQSVVPIIDDELSAFSGAPVFSRTYDRVVLRDDIPSALDVFKPKDVSTYWAIKSSWKESRFADGIRGVSLFDCGQFADTYNRASIFG